MVDAVIPEAHDAGGSRRARWWRSGFALSALIAGCSVSASAQDRPGDDTVVVTGRKIAPQKQMRRFVRQIAGTTDGQLSRYGDRVCPLVIGLSPASNQAIDGRIRGIAADAKIRLGKAKCTPNLIVAIAHDADTFVAGLRKAFPAMFADLSASDLRHALADGPVHGWSTIEVRNEDGQPIGRAEDDGVKVLQVRTASRITLPTQQSVVESILVIDSRATVGKSLAQVSDYAAMRTLAGARPPDGPGVSDTILTLFDDGASPPQTLTGFDKSYLRALYRTHANGRATSEISLMARTIVKDAEPKD